MYMNLQIKSKVSWNFKGKQIKVINGIFKSSQIKEVLHQDIDYNLITYILELDILSRIQSNNNFFLFNLEIQIP